MRILIISQYFYPESFRINELAEFLSQKKKYKIDVLTGYPNYPSGKIYPEFKQNKKKYNRLGDVEILRVPTLSRGSGKIFNLFINYISFLISILFFGLFQIRNRKYDYIFTFGTTPITVAIISILFSKIKKSKNILWVLDLWPQILIDLNILNKKSFLYKLIKKIVNIIYKKHFLILSQSQSFSKIIRESNKNIIYFPSWPENTKEQYQKNNDLEIYFKAKNYENKYKIVFTGNIGQAQGISNLIPTIKNLQDENIIFIFVGEGRKFKETKLEFEKNNIKNVDFVGHYPLKNIHFFLKKADALLITLSSGEYLNKTIPGKFSTYLQYDKPLIGLIGGEVKSYIEKFNLGVLLSYDDYKKNTKIIKDLSQSKEKQNVFSLNSKQRIMEKFNKGLIFREFCENLEHNLNTKKIVLNFIKDLKNLPYQNNFVLSGLNLAFLGYYGKKTIKIYNNLICWPDGLFRRFVLKEKTKKIPGRDIIINCIIPENIKKIIIAGNCTAEAKNGIRKKFFDKDLTFLKLPYGSPKQISDQVPKISKETLLIFTLPTPKQEQVAEIISKRERFYKIFCLGGALEMAFGKEKIPKFFDKEGLEALYRLRFETFRRLRRFLVTLSYFFVCIFSGDIKKFKVKIVNEKK